MHHFNRHAVLGAERQPAALIVLQPVTRPLDLDHAVASLARPELNQIGHAGAVGTNILEHALAP